LTPAAAHNTASDTVRRTHPVSSRRAAAVQPSAKAMSRTNGTNTYETTPIATESANHCENDATNPR
jgi:hypothetical protein